MFPNLTVRENLRMVTYAGVDQKQVEERAFDQFPRLGERRNQLAGTMSGGEQQMLAMARGLAVDPTLLFLDELSMGLAPLIVEELYEIVGADRRERRVDPRGGAVRPHGARRRRLRGDHAPRPHHQRRRARRHRPRARSRVLGSWLSGLVGSAGWLNRDHCLLERDGHVLTVTLNRPEAQSAAAGMLARHVPRLAHARR